METGYIFKEFFDRTIDTNNYESRSDNRFTDINKRENNNKYKLVITLFRFIWKVYFKKKTVNKESTNKNYSNDNYNLSDWYIQNTEISSSQLFTK